jgi:hypothetical protein
LISPATYNFTIYEGATFSKSFQLQDEDENNLGTSGWTARMQLRESYSAPSSILSLTSGDGYLSINSTGLISLTLLATQTANLPENRVLVYDIEVVDGSTVYRILMGSVTISPEVTR